MDIKQAITDKIIALLEKGNCSSSAPWAQAAGKGMPCNAVTGAAYRGVNVLILWSEAVERGYTSNIWMTFKQAQALGGQVRKGEKAVLCAFFDKVKKSAKNAAEKSEAEGGEDSFFLCKPFWLFNLAQVENLPADLTAVPVAATPDFNPIAEAEQILRASGASIAHGFDGAFYSPSKDQICLPERERFTSEVRYYATAMHELSHWTGHENRLARDFSGRFGSEAYAFEELVAELGSAFLAGHIGFVDTTIENHAAYLQSWLKVLKSDKTAIFTAASAASKATDFVLAC